MKKSFRNVCESTVIRNLCIGCGVCAGICPAGVLEMQSTKSGGYIPVEHTDGCLINCDLCLRACPFMEQNDNEDAIAASLFGKTENIQHEPELGYYLASYVGYSKVHDHRANGASGGLTTWLLEQLLDQDIVDKIACVTPYKNNPEKLFHFAIIDSGEELRKASSSCYYPVELSEVIHEILKDDHRYAITGLPCFIKSLRLAMQHNKRLNQRVIALIGLTCGQYKSRLYSDYLRDKSGINHSALSQIHFRVKIPKRPANDFAHQFFWVENGKIYNRKIVWSEGLHKPWTHDYFKQNACDYCDDLFAECADMVFMDAWLPQYYKDYRGHSIVINRNKSLQFLWDSAITSNEVQISTIAIQDILRSQSGQFFRKRDCLSYRLHLAQKAGQFTPPKRVAPSKKLPLIEKKETKLKISIKNESNSLWKQYQSYKQLNQALRSKYIQLNAIQFYKRIKKMLLEGRLKTAIKKRFTKLLRNNSNEQ